MVGGMNVDRLVDLVRDVSATMLPPVGALDELVAFEDTQVLDVLVDVARSRAGVLLDARQSTATPTRSGP